MPKEMGEVFILHKNRREAKAILLTHQLGWDLRFKNWAQAEVLQAQVCTRTRTSWIAARTGQHHDGEGLALSGPAGTVITT